MASGYGPDGEHFGEQAGNIVWESRFPKKAPGTIEEFAPSLGGCLNLVCSNWVGAAGGGGGSTSAGLAEAVGWMRSAMAMHPPFSWRHCTFPTT